MTDLPDLLYVVPTGGLIPAGTLYLDGRFPRPDECWEVPS